MTRIEDGPCSMCGRFLADNYYQLVPRDSEVSCHDVCPMCFGTLHATRGCKPYFDCPAESCNNIITGHICCFTFIEKGSDTDSTDSMSAKIGYEGPDRHDDAIRLYKNQPIDYQRDHILITSSGMTPENKTFTTSVNVPFNQHCEDYIDDVKNGLLAISKSLFHVLFTNMDGYCNARQRLYVDTVAGFEKFAKDDPSYIVEFFIHMWTGFDKKFMLSNNYKQNSYRQSNFLAIYTGVEQMMRLGTSYPGVLQSVIQRLLSVEQASTVITSTLCKLRISSSRERMRLEDITNVKNQLIKGWDMSGRKYGLIFVMYDNLGFKIRGASAGYDQYIVIAVLFISPKQLQEIGFYVPCGSPKPSINRERKNWECIRKEYEPHDILPSKKHYTLMGNFIYAHIDCLLQLINEIPTLDECRRFLQTDNLTFVDKVKIPGGYGLQL